MSWLPADFRHPTLVEVGEAHHLRPIRESDIDLDYPAVMGSRERLGPIYGEVWGWPPADLTVEEDRAELRRHQDEADRNESFNYALFDDAETQLLGCCYLDPIEAIDASLVPEGTDAVVNWWVVDELVGTPVERMLAAAVPVWIAAVWPFRQVHYGVA